jgi:hypothetical protein
VNEGADPVLVWLGLLKHLFNHPSVTERYRGPGRIGDQLVREISRDLLGVAENNLLELINILKGLASDKLMMRINRNTGRRTP